MTFVHTGGGACCPPYAQDDDDDPPASASPTGQPAPQPAPAPLVGQPPTGQPAGCGKRQRFCAIFGRSGVFLPPLDQIKLTRFSADLAQIVFCCCSKRCRGGHVQNRLMLPKPRICIHRFEKFLDQPPKTLPFGGSSETFLLV